MRNGHRPAQFARKSTEKKLILISKTKARSKLPNTRQIVIVSETRSRAESETKKRHAPAEWVKFTIFLDVAHHWRWKANARVVESPMSSLAQSR